MGDNMLFRATGSLREGPMAGEIDRPLDVALGTGRPPGQARREAGR